MANTDRPNGFRPAGTIVRPATLHRCAASQTIGVGDMTELDANGRVVLATSTSDSLLGPAETSVASSSANDDIWIWDDPAQEFEAQVSGTMTTALMGSTRAAAGAMDLEGATTVQEIDENASTRDLFIPRRVGFDPVLGTRSVMDDTATNSRLIVVINPAQHNNWGNVD